MTKTAGSDPQNYTQVPNDFFAHYLADLSEAELRVILVIMWQAFGYHKTCADISITQFMQSTGMSRQGVVSGIKRLIERGLIECVENNRKTNAYRVTINEVDLPDAEDRPNSLRSRPVLVNEVDSPDAEDRPNSLRSRPVLVNDEPKMSPDSLLILNTLIPTILERKEMDENSQEYRQCLSMLESLTGEERQELEDRYDVLSSLPIWEWPYWIEEIYPRNAALKEKARNLPIQDLRAVQHFGDEQVIRIVKAFSTLWGVPAPGPEKHDKARVKDWYNGALQIASVCTGYDPVAVLEAFKRWRDRVDPEREIYFPRPNSVVNMIGSFIPQYVADSKPRDKTAYNAAFGIDPYGDGDGE